MTTVLWIVVAAAIAAAFLFIGAGTYFYNFAIRRSRKTFLAENSDLTTMAGEPWIDRSGWLAAQSTESVLLQASDGLKLQGVFIPATQPQPVNKLVILVHGYTGRGREMAMFAHYYRETLGYHVLMPDLRGHGESAGEYIGFGWHDRFDLLDWVQLMIRRLGEDVKIVLHGVSMGGGTVLMSSGERMPDQVQGIISDCAYSSVAGILSYQLRRMFKLPAFPLLHMTSLVCKLRAGYWFGEASALKQLRQNQKPILFIHGGKDTFVPTEMVYELYKACATDKELFLVPEAGHGNAFSTDMEGYCSHMQQFLQRIMPDTMQPSS